MPCDRQRSVVLIGQLRGGADWLAHATDGLDGLYEAELARRCACDCHNSAAKGEVE